MKCSSCGAAVGADSRFCAVCGAPVVTSRFCGECGQELAPAAGFCLRCGARQPAATPDTAAPSTLSPAAPAAAAHPRPPAPPEPAPPAVPGPATAAPGLPSPPLATGPSSIQYRGIFPRFIATLIDYALYFLFAWLVAAKTGNTSSEGFALDGAPALFTFAVGALYFVICEGFLQGTLGKLLLGLRVVNARGQAPGLVRALARNLLRYVDFLPFFYILGIVLVVASKQKQRLGDRAAGTFVVSSRSAAAMRAASGKTAGGKGAAIGLGVLAVAVAFTYCAAPGGPPGFSSQSGTQTSLGTAYAKDPDPGKLIATEAWGTVPANQVVVTLRDSLARQDADRLAAQLGGSVVGEVAFINLYQIETRGATEADLTAAVQKAQSSDGVEIAAANTLAVLKDVPGDRCSVLDDPVYREGNGARSYRMIGLEEAWDIIRASGVKLNDVHVGVLDSAVNNKSGDLSGNVSGVEAADLSNKPNTDQKGNVVSGGLTHGTQVSHVIRADWDNSGVIGVAGGLRDKLKMTVRSNRLSGTFTPAQPDPSDPTKVVSPYATDAGGTFVVNTFANIVKLIDKKTTIINYSQGPEKPGIENRVTTEMYRKFLERMAKEHPDVLFVAAAGNEEGALDGENYEMGGLDLPNVITVSALDDEGNESWFTNIATGKGEVSIAAPGVDVPTGFGADGKVVRNSGTSFATPMVSAAAAMLRSIDPGLKAADIKKILVETKGTEVAITGRIKEVDQSLGGGVLRVDNAVLKVINDLRARQQPPQEPLDRATLLKLGRIDAVAIVNSAKEYTIKASVGAVPAKGTDVKIDLNGQGGLGGEPKRHLDKPGELTWPFAFRNDNDQATLKLTRLDTNSCSQIRLVSAPRTISRAELKGVWSGTGTLTRYDVTPSEAPTVVPSALPHSSVEFSSDGQLVTFRNFTYSTWAPFSLEGNRVTMESSGADGYLRVEGEVKIVGDRYIFEGKYTNRFQAERLSAERRSIEISVDAAGTFSVSKPK